MLAASFTAFDDWIQGTAPIVATSSVELYQALGVYDGLSIQVVVDLPSAAGTITVQIMHSADGIHFLAKSPSAPEINAQPLTANTSVSYAGADNGIVPSLAYVMLKVTLAGAAKARVKVFVTARDSGAAGPISLPQAPPASGPVAATPLPGILGEIGRVA